MKRIFLFLLTNIAVIVVAMLVLNLFGVESYMQGTNLDLKNLFLFALVFGFAGSFVSLAMSKWIAKISTGARVISKPINEKEIFLFDIVKKQSEKAGIKMPEIAIYNSSQPNAFATGMRKNSALVAFSTGLLNKMNKNEIAGVAGHEISHIANGDMVTMALLQGVLNTFIIFFAKIVAYVVDRVILKNDNSGRSFVFIVVDIIAQILFGILASLIAMKFSRYREFHADKGGAYLAGKGNMIAALRKLQSMQPGVLPDQMAAFGISANRDKISELFSSHPPIEDRILKLEQEDQSNLRIA